MLPEMLRTRLLSSLLALRLAAKLSPDISGCFRVAEVLGHFGILGLIKNIRVVCPVKWSNPATSTQGEFAALEAPEPP